MDIPIFDRFKQCQVDSWTTREHLCLASAVTKNGDQNWAAVSRSIRLLTSENERPSDWYSTKNCALQFDKLLEQVDIPKRKREKGESNLNETPGEILIKMLNRKQIEELEGVLEEERATYEKLRREIQLLESDQCDNRLQQFWDEIVSEQEKEDEEIRKRKLWLKEREERIRIFQSATKLQPLKCTGLSSPPEYPLDKDSEKSNFAKKKCLSDNSSSDDSDDEMETDSQATISNVSLSSGSLGSVSFSTVKSAKFLEIQNSPDMQASKSNIRAKDKQISSEQNENEATVCDSTKERSKSDVIISSSVALINNDNLHSAAVEYVKKTLENNCTLEHASDVDTETCQIIEKKQPDSTLLPEIQTCTNDELNDVVKHIPDNNCLNAIEVGSKILDEDNKLSSRNKDDATLEPDKKLESTSIALDKAPCFYKSIKVEEKKNSDEDEAQPTVVKSEDGEVALKRQISEPLVEPEDKDTNKCLRDVKKAIDSEYEIEKSQAQLKKDIKLTNLDKLDNKDFQEELSKTLEKKEDIFTKSLSHFDEEENADEDQLSRRGRKRKTMQSSPKEEEKIETSDVKSKIKMENEMLPALETNKFGNEKIELCEASSSEELHIEKLSHIDEKKKSDEEEKKKLIKNEVKDEYEFDDMSRDSTDVKEFYMSRADRRKFPLGESVCSPVVSESAPSSPASTSYGDDPESEKQHRSWKRSIMLIWNDIAAHKNASLFLRPITEDKVPGYHSVVLKPIDLQTIKKNVENGLTRSTSDFQHDVMLMLLNAKMYNTKDHNIYRMADEMMKDVMEFIEEFVSTQLLTKVLETPQKYLRRETRESSAKRGDDKKKEDKEEKPMKRRKLC